MGKKKQMRSEVKGNVKNSIGRIAFAALAVLLQIGWILILMIKLYQYSSVISLLTSLFALVVALRNLWKTYQCRNLRCPGLL